MSCGPTTYPTCPNPATAYFSPDGLPTVTITSQCCDDSGTTDIIISGVNDTGDEIWIDGTQRACADPALAPCFTDDLGGSLTVISTTAGAIGLAQPWSITIRYTYPACGTCVDETTALRIHVTGDDTGNTDLCCYFDIPVVIDIVDDAPFTLSTANITLDTSPGYCDSTSFTITNDSCISRRYSIATSGCPAEITLGTTDVTLAAAATSAPILVSYCPSVAESGTCTIEVTSIAIANEDPCDTQQVIDVLYRSVIQTPLCSDCNIIYIDGVQQDVGCDPICANVGDEICVNKTIQFPSRDFLIVGADDINNTFTVVGLWSGFTAGVVLDVTGSSCNDGAYTTVSQSYDPVNNQTTITVAEAVPCATVDGTINVADQVDCPQEATLVITNVVSGLEVLNQTYTPTGGIINLNYCFEITDFGTYQVLLTWGDCFETITCDITIDACQQFTITKTGCHTYVITDSNSAAGKINTIIVSNFSGTYSQTYTMDLSQGNTLAITLPADDVYTVTITDNLTTNTFTDIIYDFCDLITCYRKLILDIFCNEKDPCCKECNAAELAAQQFKRDELNKLIALVGTLFAYIHRDKITHMGIFSIDECRVTDVQMIMDVASKIQEILERCGECGKTTTVTSTPCNNCG